MLSQYWKNAYGLVSSGSSQMVAPSVFPIFRPSAVVISGVDRACAAAPSVRRTRSTPAVMFPHWSEPPACSVQPEVVGLQDLVAELRVADPGVAVEAGRDRLLGQHPVDPEVLPQLAEEVDRRQRGGPVQVVDVDRRPQALLGGRPVEEGRDPASDPVHPAGDRRGVVEHALGRRSRVPDQPGGPAHQHDRLVPGPLQGPQDHELDQVPDVQALRRRVEAAVVGDRAVGEVLAQRLLVGALGDQPAAVQLVDHVGHGPNPA
jgi:hypothetical protein